MKKKNRRQHLWNNRSSSESETEPESTQNAEAGSSNDLPSNTQIPASVSATSSSSAQNEFETYMAMSKDRLIGLCDARHLAKTGTKEVLTRRLIETPTRVDLPTDKQIQYIAALERQLNINASAQVLATKAAAALWISSAEKMKQA